MSNSSLYSQIRPIWCLVTSARVWNLLSRWGTCKTDFATSGDRVMIKMIISSGEFPFNVASKPWVIILCILRVLYLEEVEVQFVSTNFCRHICLKVLLTVILVSYPEITRYGTVMYNFGLNIFQKHFCV